MNLFRFPPVHIFASISQAGSLYRLEPVWFKKLNKLSYPDALYLQLYMYMCKVAYLSETRVYIQHLNFSNLSIDFFFFKDIA